MSKVKGDEMDVNAHEVVQVIGDAATAVNSNTTVDASNDEVKRAEKESGLSPEALRAIGEQTTPALLRRARRYAQRRVKRLREAGVTVSPKTGAELVAEAFLDTWSGLRIWDPDKCSFSMHLQAVIKKRVYRQKRRADRFPMLLLPSRESANDQTLTDAERALGEARRQCCPVQLSETAATVCQELLRLIARDDEAIAILRCWEDGIVAPAAIIERVGFADSKVYHRARKRLIHAARALSSELRQSAQELLRSAS